MKLAATIESGQHLQCSDIRLEALLRMFLPFPFCVKRRHLFRSVLTNVATRVELLESNCCADWHELVQITNRPAQRLQSNKEIFIFIFISQLREVCGELAPLMTILHLAPSRRIGSPASASPLVRRAQNENEYRQIRCHGSRFLQASSSP